MFVVKYNKINMNRQIIWVYLFTLTFMEGLRSQVTEQGNTHGLQDTLLDVSLTYQEMSSQGELEELVDSSSPLADGTALEFRPAQLVFGARPLGTPHSQRVTIINRANRTLHLTSISGNTNHFHSSFFEDKVLPPNANTSFSVVFLGRERGQIFASLLIQTSEGLHKYTMTAHSVPSEYRLQPLVGIKIPQNATFSPLIYLHNPHDHIIQVTEVYSSGGGVLLELPGGWTEGPQSMWRITPHSTRPVVAVKCHRMQGAHMAYVRIKVDGTDSVLVVAVEVIPLSEAGPYAVPHLVDFGWGGSRDPPRAVRLYMGNSSPKPLRITSVVARSSKGGEGPVSVTPPGGDHWPLVLPGNSEPNVHIATLYMNWRECFESGLYGGKIIISTNKSQQKIVVPYTSQVLEGGITYSKSTTRYLTSEDNLTAERYLVIKNEFKTPVYLTDIKIGDGISNYFEVKDFWPQSVEPDAEASVFKMRLKSWSESLKFESKIILNTNISSVEIPVYIYNGKVELSLSIKPQTLSPDTLDLGLVEASSTTRALLGLYNPNPAPVCLGLVGGDIPGGTIRLLGCQNDYNVDAIPNTTDCSCISALWWAVYEVSVSTPWKETSLKGDVWIHTSHERIRIPVALATAQGGRLTQIHPPHFHHCFPGTVCSIPLGVSSTFPVDMSVMCVEPLPPSPHLLLHSPPPGSMFPLLAARAVTNLGLLHLHAHHLCQHTGECYASLHLNSTVGQQWLSLMSLSMETLEFDINLVNERYNMYLNLTAKSSYNNISVRIDTTQVRNHVMEMKMSLVWPRLSPPPSLLEMPLTQVSHKAHTILHLVNPSTTHPVLVQMYMEWMMPHGDSATLAKLHPGLVPDECPANKPCSHVSEKVFHFPNDVNHCLVDTLLERHCHTDSFDCDYEDSYTESWRNWLPMNFVVHPQSCVFLMQPGAEKNITIEFLANYSARVSSLLYIRNNLTIVEVVRLSGQGVVPSFKFGNRKPGSMVPLLFDMTEKHLKDCDKDKAKKFTTPPNLTVKRTFVARNTGEIPITILNFHINSVPCEGYGFKVLNCMPFVLLPNSTYKVDIAFTPDFTLTKVERTLVIETSLNVPVNYSLVSSIPAHLVGKCASVLRRPTWEATVNRVMGSLLICIGISILLAGFYDSDRILKVASVALMNRGAVQPPLDLRAIGQMGMNKKADGSSTWDYCSTTTDKKQKENISNFKVSSWNYEDRNFLLDDSKSSNANANHSQKYEEISQSITKSRRKLGKRNSNASDSVELGVEQEGNTKDKKTSQVNNPSWKHVFTRNNKQTSQGNSSDSSDTKSTQLNTNTGNTSSNTSNTKEDTTDKHKLLEVPKKLNNLFNGSIDTQTNTNGTQTVLNHVSSNKKHVKTKCHSHSHQSNSGEEDTSSTTTESSNNEETISVSGGSNKCSVSSAGKKSKCSALYKDSYEGDGEDEEYDHKTHTPHNSTHPDTNTRWMKNRENVQTTPTHNKTTALPEPDKKTEVSKGSNVSTLLTQDVNNKVSKKDVYKNNAKKEKQSLCKKRSLDKSFVFNTKTEHSPNTLSSAHSFSIARSSPTTPPVIPTVWENKASFSDVVARSDNSLFAQGYGNHNRDSEQKPHGLLQQTKSTPIRNNMSIFSNMENKKNESKSKTSPDLGPIGSNNFYMKKSPTSWSDAITDKTVRPFPNINLQSNVAKNQTQKREDVPINANSNSFFLGSQSYFSGSNLQDNRNQLSMASESNTPTSNYNTAANTIKTSNSLLGKSIDIHANSNMKMATGNIVNNNLRNVTMNQNPYMNMDSGKYSGVGSGQSLLENDVDGSQLTGMEAFDSPMPWEGPGDDDLGLLHSAAADNMFDVDYASTNFYADAKQTPSWTFSPSLWDQSTLGRSSGLQDNMPNHSPASPLQSTNDGPQSEWGWSYNNNNNSGGSRGLGAIGSAVPRGNSATHSSGLAPHTLIRDTNHHMPSYNQTHHQQQNNMGTFDPFHSLSSIWSPGSSLDWGTASNTQQSQGHTQPSNTDHTTGHFQQ